AAPRCPPRPLPIRGQGPPPATLAGRVVSGLRFAVNFLTSLPKSLSPQQSAASIKRKAFFMPYFNKFIYAA
ncbi:MAG TPA: hypothetical protein DCD97_07255, partial [Firmicutes bacterium]|nr:hypothetical protein [Bacillota bacterium]